MHTFEAGNGRMAIKCHGVKRHGIMKIFIVEDDEALSEEIAGYLAKWGYETQRAEDFSNIAEEALFCLF